MKKREKKKPAYKARNARRNERIWLENQSWLLADTVIQIHAVTLPLWSYDPATGESKIVSVN